MQLIFTTVAVHHPNTNTHAGQGGISRAALAGKKPFLIAHRGSSGLLPEETAEAYSLAVEQGADFIECDVVLTKDRCASYMFCAFARVARFAPAAPTS